MRKEKRCSDEDGDIVIWTAYRKKKELMLVWNNLRKNNNIQVWNCMRATLLEEVLEDAHGSSQSSITGQRRVQRSGPEDQPAHSSKAANSDTEHKQPWGGDQAVACYENRAVEGIKESLWCVHTKLSA
ncbi:hypothetical protein Q8A67_019258 [Cirrhinus molitorella]|uniref:Uncharacterized protein n=1 Tax=Cirrhinus molitorella TaxID=172907 RepID=A0AA88PF70_9TELE|nr:hypothetical protein Q8A67_019258 [Cirrhinus molitorella]